MQITTVIKKQIHTGIYLEVITDNWPSHLLYVLLSCTAPLRSSGILEHTSCRILRPAFPTTVSLSHGLTVHKLLNTASTAASASPSTLCTNYWMNQDSVWRGYSSRDSVNNVLDWGQDGEVVSICHSQEWGVQCQPLPNSFGVMSSLCRCTATTIAMRQISHKHPTKYCVDCQWN